jgi:peptidoglycan DL-endopeptidase CwlO
MPEREYGFRACGESHWPGVGNGFDTRDGSTYAPRGLLRQPIVMRRPEGGFKRRIGRLTGAVLIAVSLAVGSTTVSSARPTRQDLAEAKARLLALNQRLSQLVEQYDAAKLALRSVENQLADAKSRAQRARAEADRARAYFSTRARGAYEGLGSGIDVLLGATTLSEFTDRMEFLNSVARGDVDAATRADVAKQRAREASAELTRALHRRQSLVRTLDARRSDIEGGIAQQAALIQRLEKELSKPVVRRIIAQPGPPPVDHAGPGPPGGGGGGPSPEPPPPNPPPPPSGRASIAVRAAYSAIGVQYKWGGSNPKEGFDCSGLTMWAWGQAGVPLPHSSAAQYAVLPHVDRSQLKPGDLLFFYRPISHVAMYVGNGYMIHAKHPGTRVAKERISSYYWAVYVGAGRPG